MSENDERSSQAQRDLLDKSSSLENLLILLSSSRFISRGRVRPTLALIDLQNGVRDVLLKNKMQSVELLTMGERKAHVVVAIEDDEQSTGSGWEEQKTFFGERVWIQETTPRGFVADLILSGLVCMRD